MRFQLSELAEVVGGDLLGPDVVVEGVGQDSRDIGPGALFVPLVAERDGHDYVDAALEQGAAAYLSARPNARPTRAGRAAPAVAVADTGEALEAIGVHARRRITGPVVGITGSVGKTSTKDLISAVLARRYPTHANPRSFNNEIGVPLTLANAPDGTHATVVEMGARGHGHIGRLCRIATPEVGVVTRVAAAHTSEFGSVEAIVEAKAELVECLPAGGLAVLNLDDHRVASMAGRTDARVVGVGGDGPYLAVDVVLDDDLRASWRLVTPSGDVDVRLEARGRHMVDNALLAAAVGMEAGLTLDEVAGGLAGASLSPMRMHLRRLTGGLRVLDDTYNANPTSMHSAIDALEHLPVRRRFAVIGVMAELGELHDRAHREVGRRLDEAGIEAVAVGVHDYGLPSVPDVEAAHAWLVEREVGADDALLVKASRSAGLERLVGLLEG